MFSTLREFWSSLAAVENEPREPYCHCDQPIIRIKPIGRLTIGYKHARGEWCYRRFWTRRRRDAVFASYTPAQCGERFDD